MPVESALLESIRICKRRWIPRSYQVRTRVYRLLYSHELDMMLVYLPELEKKLKGVQGVERRSIWHSFRTVCEQWTVYARYSTKQAKKT